MDVSCAIATRWRRVRVEPAALSLSRGDLSLVFKSVTRDTLSRGQALYHTAGKGTRLAPLPGAENNNKPGVKLPCIAPLGDDGARGRGVDFFLKFSRKIETLYIHF